MKIFSRRLRRAGFAAAGCKIARLIIYRPGLHRAGDHWTILQRHLALKVRHGINARDILHYPGAKVVGRAAHIDVTIAVDSTSDRAVATAHVDDLAPIGMIGFPGKHRQRRRRLGGHIGSREKQPKAAKDGEQAKPKRGSGDHNLFVVTNRSRSRE